MKAGLKDTPKITEWIEKNVNGKVGVDPYLTSISKYNGLKDALNDAQSIEFVKYNPIDYIWGSNQPKISSDNKIFVHDIKYAGQSVKDKLKILRDKMSEVKDCYGIIIPSLDHIAWLFNLRGNDIIYNPVFMSYAIVTMDKAYLYLDKDKLKYSNANNDETKTDDNKDSNDNLYDNDALNENLKDVIVCNYDDFIKDLTKMVKDNETKKFWIDTAKCNMAIYNAINPKQRIENDDPIELLKSIKNDVCQYTFLNQKNIYYNIYMI